MIWLYLYIHTYTTWKRSCVMKLVGQFDVCPLKCNANSRENKTATPTRRIQSLLCRWHFTIFHISFFTISHLNNNALVNRCQITFISCINRNKTLSKWNYIFFFRHRKLNKVCNWVCNNRTSHPIASKIVGKENDYHLGNFVLCNAHFRLDSHEAECTDNRWYENKPKISEEKKTNFFFCLNIL